MTAPISELVAGSSLNGLSASADSGRFALLAAGIVLRRRLALARDEEFRVHLALLVIASVVGLVELLNAGLFSGETAVRQAVFNTVSMMRTTGYASSDFNQWTPLTALVLIGMVMLSASAGSTSGSIKPVRHVVVAKCCDARSIMR